MKKNNNKKNKNMYLYIIGAIIVLVISYFLYWYINPPNPCKNFDKEWVERKEENTYYCCPNKKADLNECITSSND